MAAQTTVTTIGGVSERTREAVAAVALALALVQVPRRTHYPSDVLAGAVSHRPIDGAGVQWGVQLADARRVPSRPTMRRRRAPASPIARSTAPVSCCRGGSPHG
jgi:hypothetical protein